MNQVKCDVFGCNAMDVMETAVPAGWTTVMTTMGGVNSSLKTRHVCPHCLTSFNQVWYGIPQEKAVETLRKLNELSAGASSPRPSSPAREERGTERRVRLD